VDALRARRWWVVPAAVVVGVVIGLLVSLGRSSDRRAEASVLISSPQGPRAVTPQLRNLRALATSGVLAGNVRSTLRLDESVAAVRDRLDAEVQAASQVIVVSASDQEAETARQIAQEAAVVFTRLVDARFGTRTPPLHAAVIDSAQALSAPNRHFLRNTLIGAVAGLLLGVAAAALLAGRAPTPDRAGRDLWEREKMLAQRVKEVTKRERELAKRAGRLAVRERELEARSAAAAASPKAPTSEPVVTDATIEPAPARTVPTGGGGWNVNELQRAVDAHRNAPPEVLEQWRTYLFFLRDQAAIDGSLPPQFDGLVDDVFGDLVR
jgi:uncharacterized membrane-anchored protein YhcB (DUF1043 family)